MGEHSNHQKNILYTLLIGVLFLTQISNCASASQDLSDFSYALDADIYVEDYAFYQTPTTINISVKVRNPSQNDYIVYLLAQRGDNWITERIVGIAQAESIQTFEFEFNARYSGSSYSKEQYAIVASGDEVPLGKYFYVEEDWSQYEKEQNDKLSGFAKYVVPIGTFVIIIVIFMLARWAYSTKAHHTFKREYTLRSFFLPKLKGRPMKEVLADFLINPIFWIFELIILGVVLSAIWQNVNVQNKDEIIVLTFIAALVMPLIYFLLVWIYNNMVEKMPMRFLAGAFIWGITAAVISLALNSLQAQYLWQGFGFDKAFIVLLTTAIVAPVIEEIAKGLGLLVMWGHHEFSDSLHGLHLGLAVGLGFSFVENWLYFSSKTQPLELGLYAWLSIIIYRSFFNSIAHACFSASLGASLGWARSHGWGSLASISFIPGVLTAIVLHSIFNITAIMDGFEALAVDFPVFKYNPTMIVTLLSIMIILLIGATIERRFTRIRKAGRTR